MKGIRKISPYVPGEQPNIENMIKLNTNENAYLPSPMVMKALEKMHASQLQRYSSITNESLKRELAHLHQLEAHYFIIGNGSDEILAFCMLAFFNSDSPLLFPDITYGFYKVWADLFRIPFVEVPLNENFEINFEDYDLDNGGILFPNPNAPTGIYKTTDQIEKLLKKHPDNVLIVDEAYIDFGGKSVVPLIENYPNLVVTRTFSKGYSLAGLRVGYAIANPDLIQVLEAIKNSFNPYSEDKIAETLATVAVRDQQYYGDINAKIKQTREWFAAELIPLNFFVLPSQANFVMVKHETADGAEIMKELAKKNIFVRYFNQPERLHSFLRISIGTRTEMEQVLTTIKTILNQTP